MTTLEFQLHIDPSLYGFKFKDANYATVKYGTEKVGLNMIVEVFGIEMGPLLYCAISDRERLVAEAEAAARKNARAYWNDQANPLITEIIRGFAPYI
jgi:hypothetical protein